MDMVDQCINVRMGRQILWSIGNACMTGRPRRVVTERTSTSPIPILFACTSRYIHVPCTLLPHHLLL